MSNFSKHLNVVDSTSISDTSSNKSKSMCDENEQHTELNIDRSSADIKNGPVLRTRRCLLKGHENDYYRKRHLNSSDEFDSSESDYSESTEQNAVLSQSDVISAQPDISNFDSGNPKKFFCKFDGCKAVFNRLWRLSEHLAAHSGQKPFQCSVVGCTKAYTSLAHLKRHNLHNHTHTTGPTPFTCRMEGCGKTLKTRDTLIKHMRRAHSEKLFTCNICQLAFETSSHLTDHVKRKHNSKSSHHCVKCNANFSRLGKYNRHMRGHRIHICPIVDCCFTAEDYSLLRAHISAEHPKFLECHYCGKKIKDKAQMRRHCRHHLAKAGLADPLPEKTSTHFPCSLCSSVLSTKGSLKRHVVAVHETEKIPKKIKTGAERKTRWDKGIPRKSIASLLTAAPVPPSLQLALLTKENHSSCDAISNRVLQIMFNHMKKLTDGVEHDKDLSEQAFAPSDDDSLTSPSKLNS